jgi:hypothetical protein
MPHRARIIWLVALGLLFAPAAIAQPEDEGEGAEEAETDSDEGGDEATGAEDEDEAEEKEAVEPEAAEEAEPEKKEAGATGEVAGAAAAGEAEGGGQAVAEADVPRVDLGGHIRAGFGLRVRPEALPRDELDYGFFGVAGLALDAWPFAMWRAKLHVEFNPDAIGAVTGIELFDVEGDGEIDGAGTTSSLSDGLSIEEATAAFIPSEMFQVKAGVTRIPFSLQAQSKNTSLMFPTRSHPNEKFLSGADIGAIARGEFAGGIARVSLGAFTGNSLGLGVPNAVARGVVLAFRGDVNPFGAYAYGEGDPKRGPFRLGLGFGTIFRPVTLFDERTGTEPRSAYDFRLAASLRMAYQGVSLAAEYFRRQQTDSFSSRPEVADGAYAQLAWFILLADRFGIQPMVRAGFVATDQMFDPRLVGYIDGGFNFYPVASGDEPDQVKLTLQYLGERRFTEEAEAHGGALAVQLKF